MRQSSTCLFLIAVMGCALAACSATKPPPASVSSLSASVQWSTSGSAVSYQLICMADSKKEAQTIAKKYGIVLLNYENGVAVFSTQEDPNVVIQRGKDAGWPELSKNEAISLNPPVQSISLPE